MKVLLLCLRSPVPPSDGGAIAMYNMARSLKKAGMEVKIFAFNTQKHFTDPANFPATYVEDFNPEMVYLDASVKGVPALLNLFQGTSYNITRFDSKLFHQMLAELLTREKFDIVQMESLFMTPYISTVRKVSDAAIIYRSHNVEYVIWDRMAVTEKQPLKKWYLELLSKRLKKYETEIIQQLDGLIALTSEEAALYKQLGYKLKLIILPIGIDTEAYSVAEPQGKLSAVHLGSMDWMPNLEGIDWFLEKVFPILRDKEPGLKVYLAGKNMPQRIFAKSQEGLIIEGTIGDARAYLADKQIMIIPLLSGGGMRVKIIEGLAMGKTIVSTTIGAEGIQYDDQKNILIADTPEAFCDAMINCYRNPAFAFQTGKEARKLAEEKFENRVLGKILEEFYNSIRGKKAPEQTHQGY